MGARGKLQRFRKLMSNYRKLEKDFFKKVIKAVFKGIYTPENFKEYCPKFKDSYKDQLRKGQNPHVIRFQLRTLRSSRKQFMEELNSLINWINFRKEIKIFSIEYESKECKIEGGKLDV